MALDRPRGQEAAWLHELGFEARAALIEPLSMEGYGGGLVIALRRDGGFRGPDREALNAFATSVAQRLAAERSVEISACATAWRRASASARAGRARSTTRAIQGLAALRMKLANARDLDEQAAMSAAVESVLEGLGEEIDGLRHLITELRPAALDDLGLAAALEALARRAQAIDGLDVQTEIDLGPESDHPGPETDQRRLDPELESTIYRVVQEALTNVSRHAQATQATIRIVERNGLIQRVGDRRRAGTPGSGPSRTARRRLGGRASGCPACASAPSSSGASWSSCRRRAEGPSCV